MTTATAKGGFQFVKSLGHRWQRLCDPDRSVFAK
jgi:hypothetical protein